MSMERRIDLTGQRFGRITVLGFDYTDKEHNRRFWRCRCDCGTVFSTDYNCLRSGKTRSCGCIRSENARLKAPYANQVSSIPVRVEGFGDFPSASAAARVMGVSPSTLLRYVHNNKSFRGYNIIKIQ